jgi:hypothetical protein
MSTTTLVGSSVRSVKAVATSHSFSVYNMGVTYIRKVEILKPCQATVCT